MLAEGLGVVELCYSCGGRQCLSAVSIPAKLSLVHCCTLQYSNDMHVPPQQSIYTAELPAVLFIHACPCAACSFTSQAAAAARLVDRGVGVISHEAPAFRKGAGHPVHYTAQSISGLIQEVRVCVYVGACGTVRPDWGDTVTKQSA